MSVTINWQSQANKDIDSIEIYRRTGSTATIDVNNLGAPIATLGKEATQYVDSTVVNKNIYRYWIAAVKGGNRTLNFPITQGFFLNMGPGPKELKSGTWQYGWFGTVSNEEMFTYLEVRGLLSKLNMFTANPDFWDKFIYGSTILFIPNKSMGVATITQLYVAGILYGLDSNGTNIPTNSSGVNQMTKISKGESEFIIRMPRINGTGNVASQSLYNGEVRATMARLMEAAGVLGTSVLDGKLDARKTTSSGIVQSAREVSWTCNIFGSSTTNFCVWDGNQPEYLVPYSYNTNLPFIPIFELVQP